MTKSRTTGKIVKITALLMAALMLTALLSSCGNSLSGKYTNGLLGLSLEFKSGGKVTLTYPKPSLTGKTGTSEGTYEISKDKTTITMTFGDEEAKSYGGESSLEIGKDYIKVDSLTFTKDKK